MKNLLYILCFLFLMAGCTYQKEMKGDSKDSVFIAPDSVWNHSYLDSIDYTLKCKSYELYGDSNILEEGLPDSIMHRKDSIERLREY